MTAPLPPDDPRTPEERALAARLRASSLPGPSPALDARILDAARAAVATPASGPTFPPPTTTLPPGARVSRSTSTRRRRRWPAAAGVAASFVIAIGIAWQLRPVPTAPEAFEAPAATDAEVARAIAPPPSPLPEASDHAAPRESMMQSAPKPAATGTHDAPPPGAARAQRNVVAEPPAPVEPPVPMSAPMMESVPPPPPPPAPAAAPAPAQPAPAYLAPATGAANAAAAATAASEAKATESEAASAERRKRASAEQGAVRQQAAQKQAAEQRAASQRAADQRTFDGFETSGSRMRREAAPVVANDALHDAPLEDQPPASADTPAVRDAWLERIRELVRSGDMDAARRSLAEFRRRHPDTPLPDDLRPLAP